MHKHLRISYGFFTLLSLFALAACDSNNDGDGDGAFTPWYTLGEEGVAEFYYSQPFCLFVEACGVDIKMPTPPENAFGYPLYLSLRSPNGEDPLPRGLSFESSDLEVFAVGNTLCSEISCDDRDVSCTGMDPDCSSEYGIMEQHVGIIIFQPGSAEIRVLDANGDLYDRTTLTFQ